MNRFFSFIGTGDYRPCRYSLRGQTAEEVRYVQTALNLLLEPACDEAIVFCTPKAREAHEKGLVAEFAEKGLREPRIVGIPNGSSEEELWEIFRIVSDLAAEGDKIVFDVTHSFRSLPIVMTVLLRYLSVAKGVETSECLYGAWEAGNKGDNVVPVFELTPFFALDDWTHAIRDFERSGDASEMSRLAAERLGRHCASDAAARKLNAAVRKLAAFSENVRLSNLGTENGNSIRSTRVSSEIAQPLADTANGIPQLEPLLRRMSARFSGYGDGDIRNGFRAARLAAEHGSLPQAYTLLQETALSCLVERHRADVPDCCDSAVGAREFVGGVLANASNPRFDWRRNWTRPENTADAAEALARKLPRNLVSAWSTTTARRNSLNHAGTNPEEPINPRSPDFSVNGFNEMAEALERSIAEPLRP